MEKTLQEIEAAVERTWAGHFANFSPSTELHALADRAKRFLRAELGLSATPTPPAPAAGAPDTTNNQTEE